MMYNEKVVASIKVKGKILREFKDTIYIPFGEEYSVLLKNLNTKRVIINVFIDSENVVPGGLVLNAGQTIDLERSIKNNNLHAGNKFKFIERTAAIEDGPRGIKLEDGLIRVEYQFEKAYPTINDYLGDLNKFKQDYPYPKTTQFFGQIARSVDSPLRNTTGEPYMQQYYATNNVAQFGATSAQASIMNTALNDVGITVPGSKSTQQFSTVSSFNKENEKYTIVLKLLGQTPDNVPIAAPITVKQKQKCDTCGTTNRMTAHFCSKCGTSLVLYA